MYLYIFNIGNFISYLLVSFSIQRAHQNTLESYPIVMLQMCLGGLVYPVWAAIYGGIWTASKVIYGYGYAKSGPSGRMIGGILSHLGDIPLFGMMLKIAYDMIQKDKA
jgi:glutathione S-transferase